MLNAVLWSLRTGAPWADLPGRCPPYQTCHRRFQQWAKSGVLEKLLRALAEDLRSRGKRGKATKIMAVADRHGLPIVVGIASGQRNEQKLVVETLKARFVEPLPEKLIGDKAYDSDPLDAELAQVGVEMISPHHPRRRRKTQDGRKLRRYRHRWRIERLFAWLLRQRRLVNRWEWKAENFLGLLQLACAHILWRRF